MSKINDAEYSVRAISDENTRRTALQLIEALKELERNNAQLRQRIETLEMQQKR